MWLFHPVVPGPVTDLRRGLGGHRADYAHDDDGQGREKWIGVTGGIGEKKQPSLYKKMIFLEPEI